MSKENLTGPLIEKMPLSPQIEEYADRIRFHLDILMEELNSPENLHDSSYLKNLRSAIKRLRSRLVMFDNLWGTK